MQCPECGTTGMTKYSKPELEDAEALWTCPECAWMGKEKEIKVHETVHAQRFLRMCEESLSPEPFEMLEDHIIPALEKARRIVIIVKDGAETEGTKKPFCCKIGCDKDAEWQITHGNSPDDYTESCTEHIGELLTDAPEHRLYPMVDLAVKKKG